MSGRPSGTVTFLFTDIEASTRHWEEQHALMQLAFARQEAILRQAIQANGGYAYKMVGDAFQAAFSTAPQALQAALDAQSALRAEQWPGSADTDERAEIRVRMALHTGVVEERGDDYVGPALNRAARLLAAGFGGQILISLATQQLLRDNLPPGVTLRDLGEHRLKDLQQPERIFQVIVPDLPADFPTLKTLDRHPNNLPARHSALVGREKELAAVRRLLLRDDAGLLTLTGPGGVGKTRLALQIAADVIDEFPDGAYFVDLTAVHDPTLVASAIAQALGIKEVGGRPVAGSLKEYLRDQAMLLVLDNFEQLVEAANLVAQMLAGAPRLKVLATSREPLHVRGEQEFALPPLQLPDIGHLSPRYAHAQPESLEALSQNEAVALFVQRARSVKPDFEFTAQNASAVVQICARLDGLPLAIELAAARVRLLPPHAMLERLQNRLTLLTGGARDLPAHQQTMRSAIVWSYELLGQEEQKLFNCISVFAGGCTLEAADVVCNANARLGIDMFEGIAALVDKSLLRSGEAHGEPRFSMLETIREFGREQLEASGEAAATQRRYADFLLSLLPVEGLARAYTRAEQKTWLERVDTEQNNLRAAMEWSLQNDTDTALAFCSSLYWPWLTLGNLDETRNWVEQALALPDAAGKTAHAGALMASGIVAVFQSDYATARPRLEQAISLLRDTQDKSLTNLAVGFLAMSIATLEGPGSELEITEEAVALVREAGDDWSLVAALTGLGISYFFRAEYSAARSTLEEAVALHHKLGNNEVLARAASIMGDIARIEGDYAQAGPLYEQTLSLLRDLDVRSEIPSILHNLGYVALAEDDIERARALFDESLALQVELENKGGIAEALAGFAAIAIARAEGQPERSVRLYGAAKAIWDANNLLMWPAERVEYERNTSAIRARIDDAAWEKAWAEGSAMSMEQAIEYAREDNPR